MSKHIIINERIRANDIRLIDADGKQLGVVSKEEALRIAEEKGMDLILVAPNVSPAVCKIGDYGKIKYEVSKKEKQQRKSSKAGSVLKELKLTPKIEEHDVLVKVRKAQEFLVKGHKVKFLMFFRGREKTHPEIGARILDRVVEGLAAVGQPENQPKFEGRNMIMIMIPK